MTPTTLAQQYPIACGLVGDARLVLQQLTEELRGQLKSRASPPARGPPTRGPMSPRSPARTAAELGSRFSPQPEVPISPLRVAR